MTAETFSSPTGDIRLEVFGHDGYDASLEVTCYRGACGGMACVPAGRTLLEVDASAPLDFVLYAVAQHNAEAHP